eukprot:TRINITY_DN1915_c0_g1_i1.p1 TRINITY_DN1915_c0_g1~~TRINITY_DN1915_c0_g1_i1.p1  ORF type:complete len:243 (+),score=59.04 TRINITY_DN1915_c0_g1_i1:55-783(+)
MATKLFLVPLVLLLVQITPCFGQAKIVGYGTPLCGNEFAMGGALENQKYAYGDTTFPLCVVMTSTTQQVKALFHPSVDQFTLIEIENSWEKLFKNATDLKVWVEVPGWRTSARPQIKRLDLAALPFFTLLIQLDGGQVIDIKWDMEDDCASCTESRLCIDGSCAVDIPKCASTTTSTNGNTDTYDCDTKMYVGWLGTDKNSRYMLSAGQRMSRFRQGGIRGAYDSASKSATNSLVDYANRGK